MPQIFDTISRLVVGFLRQVVIDPAAPGQITFINNNGFSNGFLGSLFATGQEQLIMKGPDADAGATFAHIRAFVDTFHDASAEMNAQQVGSHNVQAVCLATPTDAQFYVQNGQMTFVVAEKGVTGQRAGLPAGFVPVDLSSGVVNQTYMQHGINALTTDAASHVTINFSPAFPNACDVIIPGAPVNGSTGFFLLVLIQRNAGNFQYEVRTLAGAVVGAGFLPVFDWVAIGH